MSKIELKFQIPNAQKAAVLSRFQTKNIQQLQRQTQYYDSNEFELFQHQLSLTQQLKGQNWIQRLKIPALHQSKHSKLNLELEQQDCSVLNLQSYIDHPQLDQKIKKLLNTLQHHLTLQFESHIERWISIFHFQNSKIRVDLDQGTIVYQDRTQAIFQLKFQLQSGTIQDFISFILPYIKRYQLYLDTQTKAQKGYLLAKGVTEYPAQNQSALILNPNDSKIAALKKIILNCLAHLLPNTTAIASGQFNSQHVHQARVAIRRLRSALSTFGDWSNDINPSWAKQLTQLFRQLGTTRDLDVIRQELLPQLRKVAVPELKLDELKLPESSSDNGRILLQLFQSSAFTNLILALFEFVHQATSKTAKKSIQKSAVKKISKFHRQIQTDAAHFLELDIAARHRTRKRLKKLRYSIDFIGSLYAQKQVTHYLKILKPAQDALGQYNDLIVAEVIFQQLSKTDPQVSWFALGWIAAQQQHLLKQSAHHLQVFTQAPPFWTTA